MKPSDYKRQEWFDFRDECFKAANYTCSDCGKSKGQKVILQLHHPHYQHDLMPWEYKKQFCVVLCKGCHAREHGIIRPNEGWELLHSDFEAGESSGETECDCCGTPMSWHNYIFHPKWGTINVGYGCAENLCIHDLHQAKLKHNQRKTFINSPRWRSTPKGERYSHGDRHVLVFNNNGQWKIKIAGTWGKLKFTSPEEAKAQAFDVLYHREK